MTSSRDSWGEALSVVRRREGTLVSGLPGFTHSTRGSGRLPGGDMNRPVGKKDIALQQYGE
jgi:hypothetical protein